jgi:hypothetical protein
MRLWRKNNLLANYSTAKKSKQDWPENPKLGPGFLPESGLEKRYGLKEVLYGRQESKEQREEKEKAREQTR